MTQMILLSNLTNILMYHLQIEGVKETSLEHRDFFLLLLGFHIELLPSMI